MLRELFSIQHSTQNGKLRYLILFKYQKQTPYRAVQIHTNNPHRRFVQFAETPWNWIHSPTAESIPKKIPSQAQSRVNDHAYCMETKNHIHVRIGTSRLVIKRSGLLLLTARSKFETGSLGILSPAPKQQPNAVYRFFFVVNIHTNPAAQPWKKHTTQLTCAYVYHHPLRWHAHRTVENT